ncbi:hypothetical protein ND748_26945, partial [Frankia sp. AiPs1]|nr:hypothetical protein [Frankia sp. AiPs1]
MDGNDDEAAIASMEPVDPPVRPRRLERSSVVIDASALPGCGGTEPTREPQVAGRPSGAGMPPARLARADPTHADPAGADPTRADRAPTAAP